jgi:ribosome biogenesis GTPase
MTAEKLAAAFPEIERLSGTCHYRNCRHDSESNCPVKQIVGTEAFPAERYASYLKLLGESRPNESL